MRLVRLSATGFRNLEPVALSVPPEGIALVGPNGHGKTNAMEAVYYPVLFRSLRGASDTEMMAFDGSGFRVECAFDDGTETHRVAAKFTPAPKRKVIAIDDAPVARLADAVGRWLAVAFIPADTALASGPAQGRRLFLDRMLALADREYLRALTRYRAALAQRNAALRRHTEAARAFESAVAAHGATIVKRRVTWVHHASETLAGELSALGEPAAVRCSYAGREDLAEPEAWPAAFDEVRAVDEARGTTTIGPHRDDLVIELDGQSIRVFGSTGQQRSAAVALKFLEWDTVATATDATPPLLLDDVFAELDDDRQARLAARLGRAPQCQIIVSAPRLDELPTGLALPVWRVERGRIHT